MSRPQSEQLPAMRPVDSGTLRISRSPARALPVTGSLARTIASDCATDICALTRPPMSSSSSLREDVWEHVSRADVPHGSDDGRHSAGATSFRAGPSCLPAPRPCKAAHMGRTNTGHAKLPGACEVKLAGGSLKRATWLLAIGYSIASTHVHALGAFRARCSWHHCRCNLITCFGSRRS